MLRLYQSSFKPNCTCRDVVEVLVIAPAVPDNPVGLAAVGGVKTIRFGRIEVGAVQQIEDLRAKLQVAAPREGRYLSSRRNPTWRGPGPINVSLPRLPSNPPVDGGAMNAFGLNHCARFAENHGAGEMPDSETGARDSAYRRCSTGCS